MPGPSVVVADAHAATRFGIRMALEEAGMRVCAEAATGGEALAAVLEHRPQACLLDLGLPEGALAAAERIRSESPETAIVVLAESSAREDVLAAVRAGARGYLLKDTDPARLPAAVAGVLRGESAIPRTLVPHLLDAVAHGAGSGGGALAALSDRELEVLEALAAGRRTDEVAEQLQITGTTVRRHAASAAAKLGVSSRAELLAAYARLREG